MGGNIYTALSNNKIPPKDCDTQKPIIQNHYPYGYEALYSLIIANNTNNLNLPIDIIAMTPTQLKVGNPLSKYFYRYKYYVETRAYFNNDSDNLYDPDELDTFLLGSSHFFDFSIMSHLERSSK